VRVVGWVGLIFCSLGLLVDLAAYHRLSQVGAGRELAESLRTLFWGMALFPLGGVLSLVLLRRPKR
jgi:hypothetical protein